MDLEADPTQSDFNCYISYDDAVIRIGDLLHAPNWKDAGETDHKRALITASMLMDRYTNWTGSVADDDQPMGWPRKYAQKPDRISGKFFEETEIPDLIKQATVEYAEALLGSDITADQQTGLDSIKVGSIYMNFNQIDRKEAMPEDIKLMLDVLGTVQTGATGTVRLVRR